MGDGYCDVSFTSGSFDIGANNDAADSITIGSSVQTGNAFGTSGMVNLNFTGPYVFPVCSDDSNSAMNMGYEISYFLLPCSNQNTSKAFDRYLSMLYIRIGYYK